MKKILSLFAAVLFAGSMMAEGITLDYSAKGYANQENLDGVAVTESGVTFTLAKGEGSSKPAYYTTGTGARTYGGNTLTIDAGEKTMTSIVFTFTQNSKDYTVDAGTYKKDDKTWTGSAKKVLFTTESGSGHNRIKAITVYLDGEGPAPVVYDTLTVAKAIEECAKLDSAASSKQEVFVEGYVVYADPFSPSYNNQTFFMSDDPAVKDSTFEAYGALPLIGEKKDTIQLYDGDKVRAFGFLKRYYDKNTKSFQLEISNPKVEVLDTVPGKDRSLPDIPTITVAKALEIGEPLADGGVSTEYYVIEGYVSYIESFFSEDFKSETFYISDDKDHRTSAEAFEVYRGKSDKEAEVGIGAKISVKSKIKKYKTTVETDGSTVNFKVLEESTFVPDTVTVEEAVELALAVSGDNVATPVYHVVKGFVNEVQTKYDSKYNNATFTMAQFPNEEKGDLKAYQANILKADSNKVNVKDARPTDLYVNVMGYLTKYKNAAQVVKGSHVAFVEAPDMDTIHCTVAEAVAAGLKLPLDGKSERIYAVTGFVTMVDAEFAEGIETFYMADNAEDVENISFYALDAKLDKAAKAGDKVVLAGRLHHFDEEFVSIDGGAARIIAAQGIENVVLTEKVQKVVVDGAIYIVRDGKMFDIRGTQVR